jgi:hypothetical protein
MVTKKTTKEIKKILVTGDVVIDHHLYQGSREAPHLKAAPGTMIVDKPAGARLLFEIINQVALSKKDVQNRAKVLFGLKIAPGLNLSVDHHSYAVWSPRPKEENSKENVWRMTQPLGYGGKESPTGVCQTIPPTEDSTDPNIIVIDDGALGFRFCTMDLAWPQPIRAKKSRKLEWIVYKMASPVAQGDLWRTVSADFSEKLILVVSISDLRREEVGITKGLSWERTIQELTTELHYNSSIRDLLKSRHLIVTFGSEGALWVNRERDKHHYFLVYDPARLEGEWGNQFQGRAMGYLSCFTAAIVNQLIGDQGKNDIGKGIALGLSAMRRLHMEGHGDIKRPDPGFPFPEIAQEILGPSKGYSLVQVPSPDILESPSTYWTIMEGNLGPDKSNRLPLYGLARRVALFGSKAINTIPYARFGKLFTVDRSEIESLRGIQRLVKDYEAKKNVPRPFSIAVFGPPGAGKSFGIKQIAKALLGKDVPILEFNLSQFSLPNELIGCFHQVRDCVLKGTTPFVFWDEFDSREYLWLQYLLAPMQDGEFREGQIVHPIGKCVFIFAGGTSYTMENFGPQDKNSEAFKKFKLLKGPDFVSRLSGYLNVLGPNKTQKYDPKKGIWIDNDKPADICFPVRRALLMRAVLDLKDEEILKIDKGLLNAFLEIDKYNHGARSLETLLLQTKMPGSSILERSDLPPAEQMSIHVDTGKFLSLVKHDLPFKMNSEILAPACHEFYRKDSKKNKLAVKFDMDFPALPEGIKKDNLAAAQRIPEVLSYAGLLVVPKTHPDDLAISKVRQKLKNSIELLAEAEHNGWMEQKFMDGWEYGTTRDDVHKIHDALIPYGTLSEDNKEKDRNSVRNYPEIVKMAGFKIVQKK